MKDPQQPNQDDPSSSAPPAGRGKNHLNLHNLEPADALDPRNLSREDSVGHEYFSRDGASSLEESGGRAEHYQHSGRDSDEDNGNILDSDEFGALSRSALTPPRALSSSSLYGEHFINSVRPLSRSFEQEEPNIIAEEDEFIFSPPSLPASPSAATANSQVTTPPSVQYPPSLSPPPPPTSSGWESQHLHRRQQQQQNNHNAAALTGHSSVASQASARTGASIHNNQKNRPPRAPNVHLRFQGTTTNISSNTIMVEHPAQMQQHHQPHNREASTGDASFLSALTDSDYEVSGMTSVPAHYNNHHSNSNLAGAGAAAALAGSTQGGSSSSNSAPPVLLQQQPQLMQQSQQMTTQLPNRTVAAALPSAAAVAAPVWGPHMTGDDDAVRGMNIDIPSSLQQPILGDSEEDEEGADEEDQEDILTDLNAAVEQSGNDTTRTIEQLKTKPSSLMEPELAVLTSEHESNQPQPLSPLDMDQLCEFETETDTLVLKTFEEQLRASPQGDFKRSLFPNVVDQDVDHVAATTSSSPSSSDRDTFSAATTQWRALQDAMTEGKYGSSVFAKTDNGDSPNEGGAANLLLDNAQMFLSVTQKASSRRLRGRTLARSDAVAEEKGKADDPFTPMTTLEDTETNEKSEAALDEAEKGERSALHKKLFATVTHLPGRMKSKYERSVHQMRADWAAFEAFIRPQKQSIISYTKNLVLFMIFPSLCLAAILFHGFENPVGVFSETGEKDSSSASVSWWILFLGCRIPIVYSLARGLDYLMSNFLGVSSRRFMQLVGPKAGLIISQSKGWPCILFFWGCLSLALLYGDRRFARHWLFYQTKIEMCSEKNPAGDVLSRSYYLQALVAGIFVGVVVTVKRYWMAQHLARRLYSRYSASVRVLMEKLVLLTEVSSLTLLQRLPERHLSEPVLPITSNEEGSPARTVSNSIRTEASPRPEQSDYKSFSDAPAKDGSTEKNIRLMGASSGMHILSVLEEWEEPAELQNSAGKDASVRDILEFRQAIMLLNTDYPFSSAFGLADSRKNCVKSAAKVYDKLLDLQSNKNALEFGKLGEIAMDSGGSIDRKKVKKLIKVLPPNKDKQLTLVEFTRSVDSVYRELKTLLAAIRNATAIDRVYEIILNWAFYCALTFLLLASVESFDALSLGLAIGSLLVSFSFIFGPASSSMCEGILMILIRRPYDIGDRITVSDAEEETDPFGSSGWIVEDISLFHTTIRFGMTREVATVSNGSLARSRIINANRSDKAQLNVNMKFGVDVPLSKVLQFKSAVQQFVHDRPREFASRSIGFRLTRVETDLGFVEYRVVVQSQHSWQKITAVLECKAKVASFCLEVQKKLDMRFVSPPMPVNLRVDETDELAELAKRQHDAAVKRRSSQSATKEEQAPKERHHRSMPSMGEKISVIAELFGDTKKSR